MSIEILKLTKIVFVFFYFFNIYTISNLEWGYSSAGRAPALQAGGPRFDPA